MFRSKNKFPISTMNSIFVGYLTSNTNITVWCYWRPLASFHINQSSPV